MSRPIIGQPLVYSMYSTSKNMYNLFLTSTFDTLVYLMPENDFRYSVYLISDTQRLPFYSFTTHRM